MKLKKNLNASGRIVRLLIAIALFAYALWKMSWIAFLAALFVLFESIMSWCVIYQLLGKSSCPIKKK